MFHKNSEGGDESPLNLRAVETMWAIPTQPKPKTPITMATFAALVYEHQRKKDGTWNIKIRVTHARAKRYIATPWYVTKDDLTRTFKIKNRKYIDLTDSLIKQYRAKCDAVGVVLNSLSVDEVVELVTSENEQSRWNLDIADYMRAYADRLDATGHTGNAKTYRVAVNSLCRFLGRDSVSVSEVTVRLLTDWAEWIGQQGSGYAAHNYLDRLRAVHNRAKMEFNDEDAGVIRIPNSPFAHFRIPKTPAVRHRALTIAQMRAIANLEDCEVMQPGNNRQNFARDVFLLSFCLVGINAADLYTCTDYDGCRLTYQRVKTRNRRDDRAEISIRIEPEVRPLLERYIDHKRGADKVFVFARMYSSVDSFTAALNIGLKKIGTKIGVPDLEFYAARHSWATIAQNDAGVDKYSVHTALNHVDDSMRVTDRYIRKSFDVVDRANRAVLDLMGAGFPTPEKP